MIAKASQLGLATVEHLPILESMGRKRIRLSTSKKILSVTAPQIKAQPELFEDLLVPANETRELLGDLQKSGFSLRAIGREMGLRSNVWLSSGRVRVWNAKRIERLYRKAGVARKENVIARKRAA